MGCNRQSVHSFPMLVPVLFLTLLSSSLHRQQFLAEAWGNDGHHIICNIAEELLNDIAKSAVEELLPDRADGNLSSLCMWADDVKHQKGYKWSAPLHFIPTPNGVCNYKFIRDCRDDVAKPGFCASGAITNYTVQMITDSDQHNLTEALLFLSHIVADIHQPLHVGFEGDKGGSSIPLYWYKSKSNLHHVWDSSMISEAKDVLFGGDLSSLTKALMKNITTVWKEEAEIWGTCGGGEISCPDEYASESIKLACRWAYPGASKGAALSDDYFHSRILVLQKRLAQAAVRLAGILNQMYSEDFM